MVQLIFWILIISIVIVLHSTPVISNEEIVATCNGENCDAFSNFDNTEDKELWKSYEIYRYGEHFIVDGLFSTLEEVVEAAKVTIGDATISNFRSLVGKKLTTIEELPAKFIALNSEELFCWPTFKVGHVHNTTGLVDRDIKITTLSISPRVYLIENFLSYAECDAIIERAKLKGMQESTVFTEEKDKYNKNAVRTSSNNDLDPNADNFPILMTIIIRAINITTIPHAFTERLQVIHYDKMEHYHAHYDWIPEHIKPSIQKKT